jgi:hypothetical protein
MLDEGSRGASANCDTLIVELTNAKDELKATTRMKLL